MYLAIVLLLPLVRASSVQNSYNGFSSCGMDGWFCGSRSEITYDCSRANDPNGRLWIWTARLPDGIKKVTATNCRHLELHIDCTRGYRETSIEQFLLTNIWKLDILPPTPSYEHLHDNAPVPHLPPYFHMENIGSVNFYKGLFRGKQDSCTYNSGIMKKMVMINVHVGQVPQGSFETSVEEINWSNVTFRNIESGAIAINATHLSIEKSHISEIQNKAFSLIAENVTFRSNRFSTIGPGSLNVYSNSFTFSNNKINEIMSRGLVVLGSQVNFEDNIIADLAKGALEAISPAYYTIGNPKTAYTITYKFTGNEILFMTRFSLHPNWKLYDDLHCSRVIVDGNKFNCDCDNIFWLRQYAQGKNDENAGFYRIMLNTTHHCGTSSNCSLSAIIPYVCQNETKSALQCAGMAKREKFENADFNATEANDPSIELEGDLATETADTLKWQGLYLEDNDNGEKTLDKLYYTDKSVGEESTHNSSLYVVITTAVLIKFLCIIAVVVWYIKRRKRYNTVEIYKYDKTIDTDTLIANPRNGTSAECENPSFP